MIHTFEEQRSALQKVEDADIKERVLRGLARLHEHYGDDWVNYIDADEFFLQQPNFCVLGQTFELAAPLWRDALEERLVDLAWDDNPYTRHLVVLEITDSDVAASLGFEASDRSMFSSSASEFAALQEAWETALGIDRKEVTA